MNNCLARKLYGCIMNTNPPLNRGDNLKITVLMNILLPGRLKITDRLLLRLQNSSYTTGPSTLVICDEFITQLINTEDENTEFRAHFIR